MKRHYLPFEKPLKDLDFEIEKLTTSESDSKQLKDLIAERENLEKEIFTDLSPWETVQLARHPNRPYTLDYINAWCDNFTELHGDKAFSDDNAVVAGKALNLDSNAYATGSISIHKLKADLIDSSRVKTNAVSRIKIQDSAVNNAKIDAGAITLRNMTTNSVDSAAILQASIATSKLQDSAVTNSKLATNAVTLRNMADQSVDSSNIKAGSITTAKIRNNAVVAGKAQDLDSTAYAANSISHGKLKDNSINSRHYIDSSITSAHMASDLILTRHYSDSSLENAFIKQNQVTANKFKNRVTFNIFNDSGNAVFTMYSPGSIT